MIEAIWHIICMTFVVLAWLLLLFLLAWGVGRFIEAGMYDHKEDKK